MLISYYEDKSKNITLGCKIINDCYVDDTMPSEFVKEKAKVFLSSLITLRNFTLPKIFPTLRNTIQFEWEFFPNSENLEDSYYLEFEVYEDKISMLYCSFMNGDYYHFGENFHTSEIGNDIWFVFRFLKDMEDIKKPCVIEFLKLFTVRSEG